MEKGSDNHHENKQWEYWSVHPTWRWTLCTASLEELDCGSHLIGAARLLSRTHQMIPSFHLVLSIVLSEAQENITSAKGS
jgi:hypothetical protein